MATTTTNTTTHTFTLILNQSVTDELADELFGAGLDDAGIGNYGDEPAAEFDREAASFLAAVVSAISDVESVPTMRVVRVVGEELVSQADIAARTGKSRQAVNHWIRRDAATSGFPTPAYGAETRSPLWRWADVAAWWAENGGPQIDTERHRVIELFNKVLDARSLVRTAEERAVVIGQLSSVA